MSLTGFLLLLVVAAVCGAIGSALAGRSTGGCLATIGVGLVGAFLGVWISSEFDLPTLLVVDVGGFSFPVVWSIAGSALVVALLGIAGTGRR